MEIRGSEKPNSGSSTLLAVASQIAGAIYLIWRIGWTRHDVFLPLFCAVLAIDVWVFVRHVLRCRSWATGAEDGSLSRTAGVTGRSTPVSLLVDVGQEPLIQVRVAIRACQEITGVDNLVVLDRIGRSDIEDQCRRARVLYVTPGPRQHEVDLARAYVLAARTPLVAVVPASVWILPDTIAYAALAFADDLGSGVAAVGLRSVSSATASNTSSPSDRDGYPLFDDRYYQNGEVGAANHIVVFRTDALIEAGNFQGGRGVGNGSFVGRTLDTLADAGFKSVMAPQPGGKRSAPWDEDVALRSRLDEVARQQSARSPRRLIEAWSAAPRALMFTLPAAAAVSGLLPATFGLAEALVFAGSWFGLAALARREAQPLRDWSDLRVGTRTLTADLIGLARGSALAIRPGALTARHARVAGVGAALGCVGCFAQVLGLSFRDLPALAHFVVIAASMLVLALVRDAIWAQSERQRRSMPRSEAIGGLATSLSPFGATFDPATSPLGALVEGDEVRLRLRIPQPKRSVWERTITAVASGQGGYVQFDLDDELFDHLLYGCAVLSAVEISAAERTGRTRPFIRRTLANPTTVARGVFAGDG